MYSRGDYDSAIASFQNVLVQDPDNPSAIFEIGKTYHVMGEYTRSIDYLRRSVQMLAANDPQLIARCILLAKSYSFIGDYDAAVAVLNPLLVLNVGNVDVENEINIIYGSKYSVLPGVTDTDSYTRLAEEYLRKVEKYPWDITTVAHIARIYNFQGLYHLTIPLIEKSLSTVSGIDVFFKNKLINELELAKGKTILESKVRSIVVTLSNRCNISCIMCLTSKHKWELPRHRIDEIISLFPYLEKIMWQGGEVFHLEYFTDLLQEAYRYPNLRQSIVTNGQLLTDEIAEQLVKNNVELTFSVDSVYKETYEYIRCGANYEKLVHAIETVANLRKRLRSNLIMNMNVVVMRSNYRELRKLVEFAGGHGFEFVCLMPLHTHLKTDEDIFSGPDSEAVDFLRGEMEAIENTARELGVRLENRLTIPHKPVISESSPQQLSKIVAPTTYLCHLPWYQLLLDYDGTVRPDCLCGVTPNAGSLQTISIAEAWNSVVMQEYRSNLSQHFNGIACNKDCITGKIKETHLRAI
ncbi:MAG: radical SAM protein [Elusimicrobiota bacterium]